MNKLPDKQSAVASENNRTAFSDMLKSLWKTYRWLFILFFFALLCDAASTTYFMLQDGPNGYELESHPVIRLAAQWFGPMLAFVSKALADIAVTMALKKWTPYFLITASIISLWGANSDYVLNIFRYLVW